MRQNGDFSLYFHVPFCTRKCDYCHFYVIPDKEPFKTQYMEALYLEWLQKAPLLKDKKLISLYFGGGTPSLLGPEKIATILSWMSPSSDVEITLEANPENITLNLMKGFKDAGINRVSIGIQAFDDGLLNSLGRTHKGGQASEAVHLTNQAGISNISIDLMYDLPDQTLENWDKTLMQALSLPISHLSLYNLTIEPHTVFYKKRSLLQPRLPDDRASLSMLHSALIRLRESDLHRYEISAFAKPGFHSRHNTGYWMGRPFLGLGPSAFSFWEGSRFRNVAHLNRYVKKVIANETPEDFRESLSPLSLLKEQIAIGLRLTEGVPIQNSSLPDETQRVIQECIAKGWMESDNKGIRLTEEGLLFHDWIASELI